MNITFGVDACHYQTDEGFTLHRMPNTCAFIYAKVTEGQGYTDLGYNKLKGEARDLGKLFAAYHFLRSDSSPIAQAHHFLTEEPERFIPVIVDVEPSNVSKPGLPHVSAFLSEIRNAGHAVGGVYYPQWWHARTGRPDLSGLRTRIIASEYLDHMRGNFRDLYNRVPSRFWNGYGNTSPTILQFADSGHFPNNGGAVDLDVFRGTRDELAATGMFHDYAAPAPKIRKPETLKHRVRVLENKVRHLESKVNG